MHRAHDSHKYKRLMQLGKPLRRSTGPALLRADPAGPGCLGSSPGETDSLQGQRFHFSLSSPPTALQCPQFFLLFFLRTISNFPHSNLPSWPLTLSLRHQGHPGPFLQAFFPLVSQTTLLHSDSILTAGLLICLYLNS